MSKPLPEITVKAVFLGIILSMVLAGANAYLGLFAGMTASASIPAAVISMGVLSLFKKHNILEDNIVQTAASAGESLAAGVIFTIPALLLMGYWETFDYLEIAKIASVGGLIGVLFTIPLRRALIVEAKLTYPEGIATAAVLEAGNAKSSGAEDEVQGGLRLLTLASVSAALMKLGQQGFALWHSAMEGATHLGRSVFGFGMDLSPALISVGYIVGRNISILVFTGGLISWFFAIPIYTAVYGYEGDALDAANTIWDTKIRYLGVGAMVVGGIWSLIKLFKPLMIGIQASLKAYSKVQSGEELKREENDIPIKYVAIALLVLMIPVFMIYNDILPTPQLAILITIIMMVFGFFFSAVAAYMAGVVGSSNNPISGVTVATVLFASLLLLAILGSGSLQGAAAAIMVGAVVCNAAAIGGDNLQDLKTGHLVGATPWKQQVMQVIGVLSAAIVLGVVLDILHTAYTIGSPTLSAPQATLMKAVAEGVFQGNLPWDMVIMGAIIGVIIIALDIRQERNGSDFRIPILAVAVGIYLPISLTTPIFIGGMLAHFGDKMGATDSTRKKGLLLAAGMITGEAIMGILVALPIFLTADKDWWPNYDGFGWLGPILVVAIAIWFITTLKADRTQVGEN
ncbi:MAG: oligopeptide transporter, OPT family [Candidatus Marinimicrobia bacterium]|nr:oligopeptide transporter, OPT family [Candidatus Neomarinimicrobiota bacterium]MBT3575085.1 oligopeptide transporter, OPT family [Candidatus Neomarinimicrobiota bacterium]MBT3678857.1 oligopeptide transporter, OPT family [Candidatus Neomarinimicrobiota bacterium]MBT3949971.1 oligopeptide transporter, OPT family [Candidatus Neomarinimicrobiota bacterium]MBT4252674.1 oligopeptide transporter, OPT family [Candidatus Neomarinimicrobiota bacterium]